MKEKDMKLSKSYKSLDDALSEKFDINEFATLNQRLKNVTNQVLKVKDLLPAPHYLLTKRLKKCKACAKILVKQGKDPFNSNHSDSINFLLRDIVPKITIYRFAPYQEGRPLEV